MGLFLWFSAAPAFCVVCPFPHNIRVFTSSQDNQRNFLVSAYLGIDPVTTMPYYLGSQTQQHTKGKHDMTTTIQPIDDGRIEPGHVAECAGCGCRGVYCHTDCGIIDEDCREVYVDLGALECLKVGKSDGSCTNELYCEDCA